MDVRQVAMKISYAVSRRSVEDRDGVRSPNGDGSGSRVDLKVLSPFMEEVMEVMESLFDWPRIRSLLKRDAIDEDDEWK